MFLFYFYSFFRVTRYIACALGRPFRLTKTKNKNVKIWSHWIIWTGWIYGNFRKPRLCFCCSPSLLLVWQKQKTKNVGAERLYSQKFSRLTWDLCFFDENVSYFILKLNVCVFVFDFCQQKSSSIFVERSEAQQKTKTRKGKTHRNGREIL